MDNIAIFRRVFGDADNFNVVGTAFFTNPEYDRHEVRTYSFRSSINHPFTDIKERA